MDLKDAFALWQSGYERHGIGTKEDARRELSYLLDIDRGDWILSPSRRLSSEEEHRVEEALSRRIAREPLAYILEKAWFWGREFYVCPDVLIPRQDTEESVEVILARCEKKEKNILEICTGSGAVGITLALERKNWHVVASDISEKAIRVAKKNAKDLGAEVVFFQADLFDGVEGRYDIIYANPPYIARDEIRTLSPEVQKEPWIALDGGEDGLEYYRKIAVEAAAYLQEDGDLFLEIGYDQGLPVKKLLEEEGWKRVEVFQDLNGFDRVVHGRRMECTTS